MQKLVKFFVLPLRKKILLGESLLLIWLIRLSLWLVPFRWLNKRLASVSSDLNNNRIDWLVIKDVTRSVKSCSRYVPYASCLTQALATRTLLQLKGQNSRLQIGVNKDENDKLEAHAWIEIDGKIIIGKLPRHHRYTVLSSSGSIVI